MSLCRSHREWLDQIERDGMPENNPSAYGLAVEVLLTLWRDHKALEQTVQQLLDTAPLLPPTRQEIRHDREA